MLRTNRLLQVGLLAVALFITVFVAVPAVSIVRSSGVAVYDPDPDMDALRRDRAFMAGRLSAAGDPLIGLAIDPRNRTVAIELSGVSLRSVPVSHARVPFVLRSVPPDSVVLLRVADRAGLIPPEPVRRVDAPADTAEANQAPTTVPVETTPSAVNIVLDNGLVIRIDPDSTSGLEAWRYRAVERLREGFGATVDAVRGRAPRVRGVLHLRVADADAKAVYRAVSTGSPVVIRSGTDD